MFGWFRIQGMKDDVAQLGSSMSVPEGSVDVSAEATAHLMAFRIETEVKSGKAKDKPVQTLE